MGRTIISEGKTYNEAVEKGLKELNLTKNDVEIKKIEDEEKRSFFSILDPKAVKVEIKEKDVKEKKTEEKVSEKKEKVERIVSPELLEKGKEKASKFLDQFLKFYNEMSYTIEIKNNGIYVDIKGKDSGTLIGYRGDTINAIESLLVSIVNKDCDERISVIVDIADYKGKRENTLKELSHKLEKTVIRSGRKITLEPMNAYERKIIHTELQNSDKVTTYSVGEEPRRKVIIDRKRK